MQVILTLQIRLIVLAHIVVDQGNRNNERNMASMIVINKLLELLLFIR